MCKSYSFLDNMQKVAFHGWGTCVSGVLLREIEPCLHRSLSFKTSNFKSKNVITNANTTHLCSISNNLYAAGLLKSIPIY